VVAKRLGFCLFLILKQRAFRDTFAFFDRLVAHLRNAIVQYLPMPVVRRFLVLSRGVNVQLPTFRISAEIC
jgi:hypothetical protein